MMPDLLPTDSKRIRERIRRYERALKRELDAGGGGDGYGKRYLLGPLYMLLGDVDGRRHPLATPCDGRDRSRDERRGPQGVHAAMPLGLGEGDMDLTILKDTPQT